MCILVPSPYLYLEMYSSTENVKYFAKNKEPVASRYSKIDKLTLFLVWTKIFLNQDFCDKIF